MDLKNAMNEIMDESGMSRYAIAKTMGRSNNYVYNLFGRGGYPSYQVASDIADICGYDLALVKRDGSRTIILDKPE